MESCPFLFFPLMTEATDLFTTKGMLYYYFFPLNCSSSVLSFTRFWKTKALPKWVQPPPKRLSWKALPRCHWTSGEAPRTLSAVKHQMKGPTMAYDHLIALCGRLLLGAGSNMDAILALLIVCTAHSTFVYVTKAVAVGAEKPPLEPHILCEQCTHADNRGG